MILVNQIECYYTESHYILVSFLLFKEMYNGSLQFLLTGIGVLHILHNSIRDSQRLNESLTIHNQQNTDVISRVMRLTADI